MEYKDARAADASPNETDSDKKDNLGPKSDTVASVGRTIGLVY